MSDTRRRGGSGVGGDSTSPGRRRGSARHGQRPQTGAAAVAGSKAHIRQPPDQVWRRNTGSHKRRRRARGVEQPDQRRLYRRQPVVPRSRRPVCGDGQKGHLERGRNGRGAPGRCLRDPRTGRDEEDRPRGGGGGAARPNGAVLRRRIAADHPQQVAVGGGGRRLGLYAFRPSRWEDRLDAAAPDQGAVAAGPHLFGHRRPGRDWLCSSPVAGGPGRRDHRAQWPPRPRR